jgi:hypothetical protein
VSGLSDDDLLLLSELGKILSCLTGGYKAAGGGPDWSGIAFLLFATLDLPRKLVYSMWLAQRTMPSIRLLEEGDRFLGTLEENLY